MVYSEDGGIGWGRVLTNSEGWHSGRIREGHSSQILDKGGHPTDKYIIERRARMRLAWCKRYEKVGNITQVCRESGVSRKTFYKWWPLYAKEGLLGLKDC